uniref:Early endosome antigen 1 n=1 Tax=Myripristis murdjan TaxID=586833 RepID=A0A667ZMU5_9TELE
ISSFSPLQTPGKGGSQNTESEQPSADLNNDQTSESASHGWPEQLCFCMQGFICPQCMKSHNTAEELFKHYELSIDLTMLRQEVQDLHASLKEERWFSGELKKELDKVQGQLKQVISLRCLILLERKLSEAETEKFNIKQMKDLFEQKAAQLATEIVDIKSRYDEEKSLREAADQRLAKLTQELQNEKQESERLQTELLQRPGVEDVEVLQKELVQVQTLMDCMTREREQESENLKRHYEELQANYTTSEMTISQLKAELEKGPQEAAVYTQQIHQLQGNLNNLQQQSQSLSEKLARKEKEYHELEERLASEQVAKREVQDSLHQRETEVQELQARATGAEASLQKAQAELGERSEEVAKLKKEMVELEVKHGELKVERKQLQQQREEKESQGAQQQTEISQLHAKLLEAERQLGELQGRLKEQRQLSGEKLKDREQQAADLQLKLSRAEEQLKESGSKSTDLQHQLEKAKQQHQELQALQQNTNGKLREAQNDLEQVLRQIGDKDQKIQNLEALLQKSKDIVSQLEAEREDLCAKIQAGEGETALLNQLKEKNHTLQEQVAHLTDKLKNQSESHKQAQDNLHEQVQEQKALLRSAQDRAQSLETSVTEITTQLTESKEKVAQLDTQLKAKTEMLLSAEAAKSAQRADLENHLETAQHALQDKQQVSVCSGLLMLKLDQSLVNCVTSLSQTSEEKLSQGQEELAANRTHQTGLEAQIQELKTARASLQQELGKRDQKLQQQDQALKEVQKQQGLAKEELEKEKGKVEELNKAKSALEKNSTRLTSELKALMEKSEKELGELQEAKQLLIQQKLEMQGQVEAAQTALEQEKKEHQATRDSVAKREEQLLVQTKEKRAREEQVKRGEEAEAKLGVQVTALNENVATLKREWQGSQRRVSELEKQTDELRGEIAVLEATVQNNQDERRALLERCVKGEGEIEKLQGKVVEMRRKLDDTTAAMQELGRENQSLQIKQSQSLTRKWAEDHEVQNCMACGKGFSVTVRKHHCRHCGNIFCAECSSKNALTPSSKKPVRVCETCFEELQG